MSTVHVDIAILGGGIGGYTAAIRAAQAGKTVALVEQDKLGGTCLHRGCIPTKALLRSADVLHTLKNADTYGLTAESVGFDYQRVLARKDAIVNQLHQGLRMLMKKNRIEVYHGRGRVIGPSIFSPRSGSIAIESEAEDLPTITADYTIVATGSRPRSIGGLQPDGRRLLSSDEALERDMLPSSMLIIGGGVIGVEWASLLTDFGVAVTIAEAAERLLPQEDEDISREMERQLASRGVRVLTGVRVDEGSVESWPDGVRMQAYREGEREPLALEAELCMIAVGRAANVEGIGLENTDVAVDNGVIKVNAFRQTTEPHIYAIGDVAGGPQLAHKAAHDAIVAVDHILGRPVHPLDARMIPRCVYGRPEVSAIGLTEREAREEGREPKVGKFPFRAVGKALVHGDSDGFVKVIADGETGDLLGVHMIGAHVTELIAEASLARLLDALPWEVASAVHPHPTFSEALAEAMLAVDGKAIGI